MMSCSFCRSSIHALLLANSITVLTGCSDMGLFQEEQPPNRPRILNRPEWATKESLADTKEVVDTSVPVDITPSPTPTEELLSGAVAKLVDKYRHTERALERQRALELIMPDVTEKDLAEANKAIQLGRRLEAEVGIAILVAWYTNSKEWQKIEDTYKQAFQAVPELRFDPSHLIEFSWATMKLGQFQKALDRASDAERNFANLASGQDTVRHRARVIECRAWSAEGLFRDAVARGDDEAVALQKQRAIQEWEAFKTLIESYPTKDKEMTAKLTLADDHIAGFRSK